MSFLDDIKNLQLHQTIDYNLYIYDINEEEQTDKNRGLYKINIMRVPYGWVYYFLNPFKLNIVSKVFIPENDTNYYPDTFFNLEFNELKDIKNSNKIETLSTSILRTYNSWLYIGYNKLTKHIVDINLIYQSTGGSGVSPIYTNMTPIPITHGGATAGMTFSGLTMQQMFDIILYPYQTPAFTSFYLNGYTSTLEIGDEIPVSQTFNWSTSNSANIKPNTIEISGFNLNTLTGLANDGNENITFNSVVTRTSIDNPGVRSWNIQAENTQNIIFSRNFSVRWDYRMYVGTSSNTILNASEIQALTDYNAIRNGAAGTFHASAGNYKYICFADYYGAVTRFYDTVSTFDIAMYQGYSNSEGANGQTWSYELVSVTNSYGETTVYRVYRTENMLGGDLNIGITQ